MKTLFRLMGVAGWKPRHYAAALYFVLSLFGLCAVDSLPWWGVVLVVANVCVSARCACSIPIPDDLGE